MPLSGVRITSGSGSISLQFALVAAGAFVAFVAAWQLAALTVLNRWRRCCRNPIIRNRTWDGVTAPYCNTCGLYLGSPIRSVEAAHNARKLFLRTAGLLAGLAAIAVLILAICGPDK